MLGSYRGRRVAAAVAAVATVAGVASVVAPQVAGAADISASISPVLQRTSGMPTADALPTVQIDGVVWSVITAGNTVYAGGNFANARPAGAALGTSQVARTDLLSFDLTTGALNTSFAPVLNGQVKVVTKSPDGSRIYVGGSFTQVNGQNRYRLAAFDAVTGQLLPWSPGVDATVQTISATEDAVYVGGAFSQAGGQPRARLAAFDPSTAALLGWAPTADATVNAVLATPDRSRVIVGGSFLNVNGAPAYGLAAVSAVDGTMVPWAATSVVRDAGTSAAILSLQTDGTAIYSTAYVYGSGGNFEGVMSADPDTGAINWLDDCHGDTYDTFANAAAVFVVGHQHFCTNIGGFPDTSPRNVWHRSTAYTRTATGLVQPNTQAGGGYGNFAGRPSPSLYDWLPDIDTGTFTGQNQGSWAVDGNSQYVVEGGEFLHVNNTAQQGLVRFAVPSIAPNKQGPRLSGAQVATTVLPRSSTSARVAWKSNWDRDDMNLTYSITRDGTTVKTMTTRSTSWDLPMLGFTDTGLTPGATYSYRVRTTDPNGNAAYGDTVTITMPTADGPPDGAYARDVVGQGATDYWRLDQPTGAASATDAAGYSDLTVGAGVTGGVAGAVGDGNPASAFSGTNTGFAATASPIMAPNVFSEEAWFQTTSTAGGKLVGFGDKNSGNSSSNDRHMYMLASGQVVFGVYNNGQFTVSSGKALNDGQWHQVVGTLGPNGLAFYVDGALVGVNQGTVVGQPYSGYWRVGGDTTWSGAQYFKGNIDDVAIYPTALTGAQVRQQYADSGRSRVGGAAPADTYGSTVWNNSPYVYYRFDDTGSGTTAADASGNGVNGVYGRGVAKGAASTVTSGGTGITVNGTTTSTVGSGASMAAPNTYSEEVWFSTTSTAGGKLVGFGNSQTGTSTSYDRHVYMLPNGQLVFGVYNGGLQTATSTNGYNDGKWHQVVATQSGTNGMRLYVDGQLVATNPNSVASAYNGYWRFGGDNLASWNSGGASYFSGRLDEGAVFLSELSAADVRGHYLASPAAAPAPPTANFTSSANGATVQFDGSNSSDVFGVITSYAWDFGDGTSGSGVIASHTYATSGTYTVGLTVTDDRGATASTTRSVNVVVPNQPPVAAFTATANNLSVSVDGSASSDPDGSIASSSWDFGDGTTATGATASHTYASAGTYTIRLTVTDDRGATSNVTHDVSVAPANQTPTAAFTASANGLGVSVDGSTSNDPDGTIASYAWDFGDGTTGTGVTASHTYATGGTYTVTLTVTDNRGGTGAASHQVTVNAAPKAAFTSSTNALALNVNGSSSNDPDGSIASYAWDFGDGTTGTGVTASHTYAASGSYLVTLTVTDDKGATDVASATVRVSQIVAADAFGRTVTGGWGDADTGGTWSKAGGASYFRVDGSRGLMTVPNTTTSPFAMLNSVSAENVDMAVDVSLDKAPTGNGTYAVLYARSVTNAGYRLKLRFLADGTVHLAWVKVVGGTGTTVAEIVVKNLTYVVGDTLRVRFTVVSNADGTTTLTGSAWKVGTVEPATPALRATDTEPTLRIAGAVGVQSMVSSTSTTPVTVAYDNLSVNKV